MTDTELYQRCQNEVAQKSEFTEGKTYDSWAELMAAIFIEFHKEPLPHAFQIGLYSHKAALLGIQKAREEGTETLEALRGMVEHYEKVTGNWNHNAYIKAKKIAEQGR